MSNVCVGLCALKGAILGSPTSLLFFSIRPTVEFVNGHVFLFHVESKELDSWTLRGSEGRLSLYSLCKCF